MLRLTLLPFRFAPFFDVAVKIYAAHLVLFSIAVVAPDLHALLDFFWRHKRSAPTGVWVPPAERRRVRIGTRVVEILVLALFLFSLPSLNRGYAQQRDSLRHPSPLGG